MYSADRSCQRERRGSSSLNFAECKYGAYVGVDGASGCSGTRNSKVYIAPNVLVQRRRKNKRFVPTFLASCNGGGFSAMIHIRTHYSPFLFSKPNCDRVLTFTFDIRTGVRARLVLRSVEG